MDIEGGCLCEAVRYGMPRLHENGKVVLVPAGGLDGRPELSVGQHIFAASKAPWDEIGDAAPRHDEWAPE